MKTFRAYIEVLKSKVDIVEIIESSGPEYEIDKRGGRYLSGVKHDSLVITVDNGSFYWNSQGTKGDVFDWLEIYENMPFWEALKYLAKRYNEPIPKHLLDPQTLDKESQVYKEQRNLYTFAAEWMAEQLKKNPQALEYARGRGWTDETIKRAKLGFSGQGTQAEKDKFRKELVYLGIDPEQPQAVAFLGYQGDIDAWGNRWDCNENLSQRWREKGRIWGMLDFPRLVYPHLVGGKVIYFSARNLDKTPEGHYASRNEKPRMHNLDSRLCGPRRIYYNHAYRRKSQDIVIVEGPACAVSLAQWRQPAVALMGISVKELTEIIDFLRARHKRIFWATDNDDAGLRALKGHNNNWDTAFLLGPLARVVKWPAARLATTSEDDETRRAKDANDLNQLWQSKGLDVLTQIEEYHKIKHSAKALVNVVCDWAGKQPAALKDDAEDLAFKFIVKLPEKRIPQYRKTLANLLDIGVREFSAILSDRAKQKKADQDTEIVYVLRSMFIDESEPFGENGSGPRGWLLDYLYDPETGEPDIVYRDPEGKIDVTGGEGVIINDKKYLAMPPDEFITRGIVKFPSELPENGLSTMALIEAIERFVNAYYLLPNRYLGRIVSYYVLLTWVFDCFSAMPILRAMGGAGAGKSEFVRRVGEICNRAMKASGSASESSLFRATARYGGTVIIDEADLPEGGDASNPVVKWINIGCFDNVPIWRSAEMVMPDGTKDYGVQTFDPYCPKLVAMRKEYKDDAVGTRALTIRLIAAQPAALLAAGVNIYLNDAFYEQAQDLRNLLLRWRMENYKPRIVIDENALMDVTLDARTNQVTMPIKALAMGDEELMQDITKFLRAYQMEQVKSRSMTIPAYIVEALWNLYSTPESRKEFMRLSNEGAPYFWMADIRKEANRIFDEIQAAGSDEQQENKKKDELQPKTVGTIIREELNLETGQRQGAGVPVFWDYQKMVIWGRKYGVFLDEPPQEIDYLGEFGKSGDMFREEREKWQNAGKS